LKNDKVKWGQFGSCALDPKKHESVPKSLDRFGKKTDLTFGSWSVAL